MEFGTVLIVVAIVAVLIAAVSYRGSSDIYSGLGREGGLEMRREPAAASERSPEAREEIRQMLEAKSARREARGQAPLDIDAEIEALTRPAGAVAGDPALRDEVRQLVVARNERRRRQGKEPLDVEAEIKRQLHSAIKGERARG